MNGKDMNLRVSADVHRKLKQASMMMEKKLFEFTETVIEAGLQEVMGNIKSKVQSSPDVDCSGGVDIVL